MSTEEIKMIVDLLSNATNGAKDIIMVMLGLEFVRMLLTLVGVLLGIWIITRMVKGVVRIANNANEVERFLRAHAKDNGERRDWCVDQSEHVTKALAILENELKEKK